MDNKYYMSLKQHASEAGISWSRQTRKRAHLGYVRNLL